MFLCHLFILHPACKGPSAAHEYLTALHGMTNDYLVLRAPARTSTCLRVHFCTVCVLTAGRGGEKN